MKNKIALGLAILIAASSVKVNAGERGWATAGKVLTGVGAVLVLDRILNPPQQTVVIQQPVVYSPPVVVQPTPVVVQPQQVVYVQPTPVVYYNSPTVIVYPGCPTPVYRHYHHH